MWHAVDGEVWGERIEDRGSQITYSALGQRAPLEAKRAWDTSGTKKELLRKALEPLLPDLEVRGGGSTSIDITEKGIDKAYGVGRLAAQLSLEPDEIESPVARWKRLPCCGTGCAHARSFGFR